MTGNLRHKAMKNELGSRVGCLRWVGMVWITGVMLGGVEVSGSSVARIWNEQILAAIRIDTPHPPVHARNLFHLSVAMYDAWAAYDADAVGYVYREKHLNDFQAQDLERARAQTISHAAYRLLKHRYSLSVNAPATLAALQLQMLKLGLDSNDARTDMGTAASIGNLIGETVVDFARDDGSLEDLLYQDFSYQPVNRPLVLPRPGQVMSDPNRWQPLAFDVAFTQNGLEADEVQTFLGSHWGQVRPFAMALAGESGIYHDPGIPPQLGGHKDSEYKSNNVLVLKFSSLLDPDQEERIDISPNGWGNNTLGENDGTGYPINPATGQPYEPNWVKHGDFGRVLAEYWADGPASETPPGHWNLIANQIADHPLLEKRFEGKGPNLNDLEWDVKVYFALNASMHDAAIAAWGCKRVYDYVRPISSIRYMAQRGQSSHPELPSYHPDGLPLVDGLIEVVTTESSQPGERHEDYADAVGLIVVKSWKGEPEDKVTRHSGVGWIPAELWVPYQRDTFVTPAFAGYVSGHSTFSRAGAEVLTQVTGSPYFPGGIRSFVAPKSSFLHFEMGPSETVELQWATYYDASDQAGISRLYGGIHVPVDDGPGRIMGSECGMECYQLSRKFYDGSILPRPPATHIVKLEDGEMSLHFATQPGRRYLIQSTTDLKAWVNRTEWFQPDTDSYAFPLPQSTPDQEKNQFFRVMIEVSAGRE